MSPRRDFDPTGPLPSGRVVLEASAGTGKTWTIAALATRYVAEHKVPIEQLLIVTFTRSATSELRERVRARLSEAAGFLATSTTGQLTSPDPVLNHFGALGPATRLLYRQRLEQALATFDRATISTLHGFATRLLRGLGLLSATPRSLVLMADYGELLDEALSDLLVARFAESDEPPLPMDDVESIAAAVLSNPDADIRPRSGEATGVAALRAEFARLLRRELSGRSERAGILTYDDLLLRAHDALTDPAVGALARRVIRRRFRVALIDEFQDTDRIQWEILDQLFPADDSTLAIIGDPKQAIYAFRGADVDAYLTAVRKATDEYTLTTNFRSDQPLINGLDVLFHDVEFGDPRILYRKVEAPRGHQQPALAGAGAPLQIRQITRQANLPLNKDGSLAVEGARQLAAEDAAAQAVALLSRELTLSNGPDGKPKPLAPADIAVLCRTRVQVAMVEAALTRRGVPAVMGRSGSVLDTPAAGHWLTLLRALEIPSSPSRARQAALTPFVGWSPRALADASDDSLLPLHDQLTGWAHQLHARGVPALIASIEADTAMTERSLGQPGGERTITDLHHIAQLLHTAHRAGGIHSLSEWLADEMAGTERKAEESETRVRRLETDAAATQVLTIHGAKGLQFPVVFCPFLWDLWTPSIAVPVFHPGPGERRCIDVGGRGHWPGFADSQRLASEVEAGEEMRLAYVGLTRARHHLVVWWAPCKRAEKALLSRVIFRDPIPGGVRDKVALLNDERHTQYLTELAAKSGGTIGVTLVRGDPDPTPWVPSLPNPQTLDAARFQRGIDRAWRRTSFSGLTAEARDRPHPPDADVGHEDDEPSDEDAAPAEPLPAVEAMPAGTRFGTLIHRILEQVDFAASDLHSRLRALATPAVAYSGIDTDADALVHFLEAVIRTPLFPGAQSPTLADLPAGGWVSEMEFELPVAVEPGDKPLTVGIADLADLLAAHLPADHRLSPYPERLRGMAPTRFRGYLTGEIDLVACLSPAAGQPAYWVLDYKTNLLSTPRGDQAAFYRPARLARAMVEHDYVLQALLYQVALHRHLRSRLPGYDPAIHLGGAMYLFLRGMTGSGTPEVDGGRRGIFAWPASPALIDDIDQLLRRGKLP